MRIRTFHSFAVAISMAAVLALSGCGGSSSTTPESADGGTTPPTPDGGTRTLTVPNGLDRSSAAPVKASSAGDTLATLLPNPASMFAPLAALVGGNTSEESPSTELASDLRVKTVSSDGNNGFRVTWVAGGEEQTIHFEAADYLDGRYYYLKEVDGVEYFLATHTDSFERANKNQGPSGYRYFDHNQFGISDEGAGTVERNYLSYGARTDASGLPAGEATYVGSMRGYTYPRGSHSIARRDQMRGGMRLTADFDAGALDGLILGISVRRPGESEYSPLSDTTWFEIGNGRIVDGQLAATLTGRDSNAAAAMDATVRGYEGGVLGEFYGPAAEEVGGVLNASRDDRVMAGWIGGTRSDPNDPNGLVASTAAPAVYANDAGDTLEDLIDSGTRFAPLSSTLLRDSSVRSVKLTGDSHVKAMWVDEDGAHVTYVVEGEERMVLVTPDDFQDGYYERDRDGAGFSWWSHTRSFGSDDPPRYRHFDVNTFVTWGPGPSTRHYISSGTRTDASSLPAGSASYAGGMSAENYNQGEPSNALSRIRMRGDLTLTANFDESTLEGAISGIRVRRPGEDSYSPLPDTTRFAIGNGRITGGRFSAALTGTDSNAAAALRDSVRGFQGDVLGEFYGPAAEEVGGVLSARRDEDLRVMGGAFHGEMQQ